MTPVLVRVFASSPRPMPHSGYAVQEASVWQEASSSSFVVSWSWSGRRWDLGRETIDTWVDSKGTIHYSDTPTGEARSVDDKLPPAASFATQPDSVPQSETPPPALPAQGVTVAAAATGREELFNPWNKGAEDGPLGRDEDFALGRDGPFGPDNSEANY